MTSGREEVPGGGPETRGSAPTDNSRRRGRFGRIMRRTGRFFLYFFAAVGGLFAVLVTSLILIAVLGGGPALDLPDRMVLRLDLDQGIVDGRSDDPLRQLAGDKTLYLRDAVAALAAAESDERVAGLVVNFGGASIAVSHAQELRDAVASFRRSGKFAMAFAPSFGSSGNGTAAYYLAAAADVIWMQPSGLLALIGISVEAPYLRDAFDSVGIEPEFAQRHEYKSAMEPFTRTSMSAAAHESLSRLLESWMAQIVSGIAADRGIGSEVLRAIIDRSPLLSAEAKEAQLVDRLGYAEDFAATVHERAGPGATPVDLTEYAALQPAAGTGTTVALIYGVGPIQSGDAGNNPFGSEVFAADIVAQAIDDAVDDSSIKAILLRVDSPGGSYLGSDTVRRAVLRAREKQKPVVVSMGRYGASGGYFVAMGADRVIAQPATLTGSIGVFGGKFATKAMWSKLGIAWARVSVGAHAGMWSPIFPFSESAAARHEAMLDFVYRDFTEKLAADRKLPQDRIDDVARGRVWSGTDAREAGLVDALGGYAVAADLLRDALNLEPGAKLDFVILPEPLSPLERLRTAFSEGLPLAALSRGVSRSGTLDAVLRDLEPLIGDTSLMRPRAGILQLPPLRVVQ